MLSELVYWSWKTPCSKNFLHYNEHRLLVKMFICHFKIKADFKRATHTYSTGTRVTEKNRVDGRMDGRIDGWMRSVWKHYSFLWCRRFPADKR